MGPQGQRRRINRRRRWLGGWNHRSFIFFGKICHETPVFSGLCRNTLVEHVFAQHHYNFAVRLLKHNAKNKNINLFYREIANYQNQTGFPSNLKTENQTTIGFLPYTVKGDEFLHRSTTSPRGLRELPSSITLAVTGEHSYLVPNGSSFPDRPHLSSVPLTTCRRDTNDAPPRRVLHLRPHGGQGSAGAHGRQTGPSAWILIEHIQVI
jgi:hypothetical protein